MASTGKKASILVVDDVPNTVEVLQTIKEGRTVYTRR